MIRLAAPPIVAALLAVGLTGCTNFAPAPSNSFASSSSSSATKPRDPLLEIHNEDSDFYVSKTVEPALHKKGTGPVSLDVPRLAPSISQLKFFITCAPASNFTITLSKFYSGPCSPSDLTSSGSIPLPSSKDPLNVTIDVPKGVQYWLVAIPIE